MKSEWYLAIFNLFCLAYMQIDYWVLEPRRYKKLRNEMIDGIHDELVERGDVIYLKEDQKIMKTSEIKDL